MAAVRLCSLFGPFLSSKCHLAKHFVKLQQNFEKNVSTYLVIPVSQYCTDTSKSDVPIIIQDGIPVISLLLPSTNEICRFPLKVFSQTVGDFLSAIQQEDVTIREAAIYDIENVRLSKSTTLDVLFQSKFKIVLDTKSYTIDPPKLDMSMCNHSYIEMRNIVAQLYSTMNVRDHQLEQEKEISDRIAELKLELEPYEECAKQLQEKSEKHTNRLAWLGLGLMGIQMGFLARLTWWEYSWDIMEPVTYFITYGTSVVMFAYYVVTKQEYNFPLVKDRQFLITFHKHARKRNLNMEKYNSLKEAIAQAELDLSRLRDPLQVNLPIQQIAKPPRLQ